MRGHMPHSSGGPARCPFSHFHLKNGLNGSFLPSKKKKILEKKTRWFGEGTILRSGGGIFGLMRGGAKDCLQFKQFKSLAGYYSNCNTVPGVVLEFPRDIDKRAQAKPSLCSNRDPRNRGPFFFEKAKESLCKFRSRFGGTAIAAGKPLSQLPACARTAATAQCPGVGACPVSTLVRAAHGHWVGPCPAPAPPVRVAAREAPFAAELKSAPDCRTPPPPPHIALLPRAARGARGPCDLRAGRARRRGMGGAKGAPARRAPRGRRAPGSTCGKLLLD